MRYMSAYIWRLTVLDDAIAFDRMGYVLYDLGVCVSKKSMRSGGEGFDRVDLRGA